MPLNQVMLLALNCAMSESYGEPACIMCMGIISCAVGTQASAL